VAQKFNFAILGSSINDVTLEGEGGGLD